MKRYSFRQHQIRRTCTKTFDDYHSYSRYLHEDFSHRCCYCNVHEKTLGLLSFQIDHFIPEARFKGIRDELKTQYNNLMLACPKCNNAKSDQYEGNILSTSIENQYFYNPDQVDYNTIFYRNEIGGISSDDPKGKEMIRRLKLYRKLHNLAWVLEQIDDLLVILQRQEELECGEKREKIQIQRLRLLDKRCRMQAQFIAAYRSNR
ncbi:MAG: HNH endonuclease [Lachnospiraceae bacterium]|nr:HNH endonuclease [Lachnospiraceae bacterium]